MYDLTEEQVKAIRNIIEEMLNRGRKHFEAIDQICDVDYLKGRRRYPIPALIYTGFDTNIQGVPKFTIQKIQYGKGRFLPELYNRDAVIQLYSNSADPSKSNEVKNKLNAYGDRFQIIGFTVSQDTYQLEKLTQVSYSGFTKSGRAQIGKRRVIYQRQ